MQDPKTLLFSLASSEGCGLYPVEDISESNTLYELGFDSLRYLELIVLIEENFHSEVPDESLEITYSSTIGELLEIIQSFPTKSS